MKLVMDCRPLVLHVGRCTWLWTAMLIPLQENWMLPSEVCVCVSWHTWCHYYLLTYSDFGWWLERIQWFGYVSYVQQSFSNSGKSVPFLEEPGFVADHVSCDCWCLGALKAAVELHLVSPTTSSNKRKFVTQSKASTNPNFNETFKLWVLLLFLFVYLSVYCCVCVCVFVYMNLALLQTGKHRSFW